MEKEEDGHRKLIVFETKSHTLVQIVKKGNITHEKEKVNTL